MNQTLHIFAKDTRRFWPEILISIALLAAFAYILPFAAEGRGNRDASSVLYLVLQPILYVLIPISWWILTSRVVHEENLVGDRQFWITRPYKWLNLLAAKLLFLVAFVLVPIGLMQGVTLFNAGFDLAHSIPGILFSVVLMGVLSILPLAAVAAVTPSFAKMTVALLAIVIAVLIFGSLIVPRLGRNFGVTPHAEWPFLFITFAGCSAIVLLQYARRRTLIARVILGATIFVLVLWPVLFSTLLMPLYFDHNAAGASGIFSVDPTQQPSISEPFFDGQNQSQNISVPVVVSGVAADSIVAINAVKITLTTGSGLKYNGPWHSLGQSPLHSGGSENLQISVPTAFIGQVKASSVSMEVTLGVTSLKSEGTTAVPFPVDKAKIPGIGICTPNQNPVSDDRSSYGLSCTSALRAPGYIYATAHWSDSRCNQPLPAAEQLVAGDTYIGSFDQDPAEYGISPLVQQQLSFSNATVPLPNNAVRQRFLCAGTPMTFTRYAVAGRTSVELAVPNLNLVSSPSTPLGGPQSGVVLNNSSE